MAVLNKLTVTEIRAAPPGTKLQDGAGLILERSATGGKWTFRYSFAGRRRAMGLGSMPDVSLAAARKARAHWAALLQSGLDPISERQRIRDEEAARHSRADPTLEELALMVFEARKAKLRGDGERGRWFSPIRCHVLPKIGRRRASSVTQMEVKQAIAPIWRTKHETAEKALYRLKIIFREGKLMGLEVDPFTVDAARHMLGHVEHVETPIASTPWQDVPALFARLDSPTSSHLALRWIILTAARGDSARGARFDEIEGDVWTVPPDRMKGQRGKVREFRVPLSAAALDVLEVCRDHSWNDYLFPSPRVGFISVQAAIKILDKMGEAGRPHGFRTSFRSWVQETDAAPWEVAETALAHSIGSKVERSYARSDLLDRRRILMQKWADFVTGSEAENVVRMPSR